MSLSKHKATLLALALLASACSNISNPSPTPRSKQDLGYRGESLSERFDALSPDSVLVSGGETEEERKSEEETASIANQQNPKQQNTASSFQFEEEQKREEIEIPVVTLSESGAGSMGDKKQDEKNTECSALTGIAGQWLVRSGNSLIQSTNLSLIQDFDGMKTYSASTTSSQQVEAREEESTLPPLSYTEMESATVRYDTNTCRVVIQKDLQESSSTYLISSVNQDGSEFKLKKCTDEQCKSTSEEKTYKRN